MTPCLSLRCLVSLAGLLALAACAGAPPQPQSQPQSQSQSQSPGTRYVIVRHAEKASDDPRDPSLSPAGRQRALRLAERLREEPLRAVYVTHYRRTAQTAEPSAQAHALVARSYDARQPAAAFAAQLRRAHSAGSVLVVGHSNTAPDIAAALCACSVAPMPETEFDRRMIVDIDAQGRARLRLERDRPAEESASDEPPATSHVGTGH